MDRGGVDVEQASAGEGVCGEGRRGLEVLKQVQRLYEEKLGLIERETVEGETKLQLQVELLRSWVADLASQNALLAGAVEDLEREATSRLMAERRTHQETQRDSKKGRCDAVNELKILHDSAQKEIVSKDREIRKLNKEVQQYEQTIMNLRSEISQFKYKADIPRKDVSVMVGFCCHGRECVEPARYGCQCEPDVPDQFQQAHYLESFKSAGPDSRESARALRQVNAAMSAQAAALRRVVYVLRQQLCAAAARAHFKDDIIREMRRQLRQAKVKLKGEHSAPPSQASSRLSLTQGAEGGLPHAALEAPTPAPATPAAPARSAGTSRLRRPRAVRRDSAPRLEPGSDSDTRDCDLDGSGGDGLVNLPN